MNQQPINRRNFLRHSLTTLVAMVVAACTPNRGTTAPTATISPSPQPTATPQATATLVPVTYLPQPPLVNEVEGLHPPVYASMEDYLSMMAEEVLLAAEYAQWHRLYLLEEEAQAFTANSEAEARALYVQAMQAFKEENDRILVIQQAAADGSLISLLYHHRENGIYGHFTTEVAMLPWGIWQPDSQARLVLLAEDTQPALTYNPEDGLWYLFQLAEGVPQAVYIPHTAQWIPTNEAGEPQMVWNSETRQFEYDVPPIPESEKAMLDFVEHHGGVLHKPDKNDPNDTYYYHVTKQVTTPSGDQREVDLRLIEFDPSKGWIASYETAKQLLEKEELATLIALSLNAQTSKDLAFLVQDEEDMKVLHSLIDENLVRILGLDERNHINHLMGFDYNYWKPGFDGIDFGEFMQKPSTPSVFDGINLRERRALIFAQQPQTGTPETPNCILFQPSYSSTIIIGYKQLDQPRFASMRDFRFDTAVNEPYDYFFSISHTNHTADKNPSPAQKIFNYRRFDLKQTDPIDRQKCQDFAQERVTWAESYVLPGY
jgi:hypothetical protein